MNIIWECEFLKPVETMYEDYDMRIKALHILHDKIWDYANNLLKRYNPCNISNGSCLQGQISELGCHTKHDTEAALIEAIEKHSFCCSGCKYITPTGCNTKALKCKVSLCSIATRYAHPQLLDELKRLRVIIDTHFNFYDIRHSFEDHVGFINYNHKCAEE